MASASTEINFDGLVGPTHSYAGLAVGNLASDFHRQQASNPRAAALQGLEKMKWVADQGLVQAVLPPQHRPNLGWLRQLGFSGTGTRMIDSAWKADPRIVAACYSASSMWTANAATVSPSPDCGDRLLHLTVANLTSGTHRCQEAPETMRILSSIFADQTKFQLHDPLPSTPTFADEGAANHTRFCLEFDRPGLELFVYGRDHHNARSTQPERLPSRQSLQASQAIARLHQLPAENVFFAQQSPAAIDAGVFHNDVISVGHQNVFLYHEQAFADPSIVDRLDRRFRQLTEESLVLLPIKAHEVSLDAAVKSYMFNSQILTLPTGKMVLLCPLECKENETVRQTIERIIAAENPLQSVRFFDVRQSMNNGGGPACLRLRVMLNTDELAAIHDGVLLTEQRYELLKGWIERHYRDRLRPQDLRDPQLINECRAAMEELSSLLNWPAGFFLS